MFPSLRCRAIAKENKQFKETVETQDRMIESQNFVMTNLRNGIDYLKQTCKNAGETLSCWIKEVKLTK